MYNCDVQTLFIHNLEIIRLLYYVSMELFKNLNNGTVNGFAE